MKTSKAPARHAPDDDVRHPLGAAERDGQALETWIDAADVPWERTVGPNGERGEWVPAG